MRKLFLTGLTVFIAFLGVQAQGVLSGNFQSNFSVFDLDSAIGAYESPQYTAEMSSAEAWLFLNYQLKGFDLSARYDLFNNSNLLIPTGSYSGHGLGFWQIRKRISDLTLTAGSFYDQFGSGLVFRAYENRPLGLDYAIQGVHARYDISPTWMIKGFTGNQKGSIEDRFSASPQIVKGINTEKDFILGKKEIRLSVGASAVNRTLAREDMNLISAEINGYSRELRFDPKYNTYAYNGYFNVGLGDFALFGEYVGKTQEAIRDIDGLLKLSDGKIYLVGGSFAKNKLGKSKKGGLGMNVQYRVIDHFQFRNTPNAELLNGFLTYQPSLTRQASYRLLARYIAQALDLGEKGIQADLFYTINRGKTLTLNYSDIHSLEGEHLYQEYYADYEHKFNKSWKAKIGLQKVFYNQRVYQGKDSSYKNVETITPFGEVTYKIDKRNSLRMECQYLMTQQDLGSFVNAILELNMSPHWSFSVSDMVNVDPVRHEESVVLSDDIVHYYSVFAKYNIDVTSFTLAYIKQVEGVNCTGGICRIEPAFSGIRFTLQTNF
ncbi:MAG: hypothetical protein H6606_09365 [Flavobacteriales bacterium]|nr:hypothetical protein [Flavobacteriales bacterium]